jgi:predicted TPR repeat methyltransferase
MAAEFLPGDPIAEADELIAKGEAPRAVELLTARLAAGRGGLLARLALARALNASGHRDEALESLRETSALAPGIAEVACALGELLLEHALLPTAIAELQRALRLDPAFSRARYALGCAWLEAGEPERALGLFAEIAQDAGFAERTAQKRAEAEALLQASRAPAGYVRHLFDQFSADYDSRMRGTLAYRAPEVLRALADLVLGGRGAPLSILDLGCGTGLSGLAFADLAAGGRLDGVDLSPRMIEAARAHGCYDALTVGDLEMALRDAGPAYDLILAADTFVYLGDLTGVFAAAARRLAAGGLFLFTVEQDAGNSFSLGPKRRYRHSEAYLRAESGRAGLDVCGFLVCNPRSEGGVPVEGFAVAVQKGQ